MMKLWIIGFIIYKYRIRLDFSYLIKVVPLPCFLFVQIIITISCSKPKRMEALFQRGNVHFYIKWFLYPSKMSKKSLCIAYFCRSDLIWRQQQDCWSLLVVNSWIITFPFSHDMNIFGLLCKAVCVTTKIDIDHLTVLL